MNRINKLLAILIVISIVSVVSQVMTPVNNPGLSNESGVGLKIKASPIGIDGNDELKNTASSGNGLALDPYILEDYIINASGSSGINISNTNAYFTLRNCTVYGGIHGIYFSNVTYGRVENNTIYQICLPLAPSAYT